MKKLFDAITARAEGARPPLDQDGWRLVLRDLQQLQHLVSIVDMSGVLLSYTESLLSSGRHVNIDLAASVMEGLIDTEDDSVRLILAAWRHYYSRTTLAARSELVQCADLLSFAVSHCDNNNIGDVLQTILTLEQRSITRMIDNKMMKNMENVDNNEEEVFDDALETGYQVR